MKTLPARLFIAILQKYNIKMMDKSVRIPQDIPEYSKDILYFDESGIADLSDYQTKYFILTCVITEHNSFERYNPYYYQLKYKYFNSYKELHSHDLFYKPSKKTLDFISELSCFIDNIPFGFSSIAINKETVLMQCKKTRTKRPLDTTLNQALSIYIKQGLRKKDFFREEISVIIKKILRHKMINIDRYYPLEKSILEILKKYTSEYAKIINKGEKEYELFLEDNPNKVRILKYIERFKSSYKDLATGLSNVSFPSKKAKYLGLELADIISFGYNLFLHQRLFQNKSYAPIWNVINKRRKEFKRKKMWESFLVVDKRERPT